MGFDVKLNGDIELKQGDSDVLEFTFTDDDNNAIDISNTTLYFSVKKHINDTNFIFQKIVTNHADASNGISEVVITSQDTNIYGVYLYDCVIVFQDGARDSFLPDGKSNIGKFTVHRGITNVS